MRYNVVEGSDTGHCCFAFSVVDSERTVVVREDGGKDFPRAVCECLEREDADLIAAALNRTAGQTTGAE